MRKFLAVLLALSLCAVGSLPVNAAARLHRSVLISYSQDDSTEQASKWVDVGDASFVILRCTSTHAAFNASTDADSTRSDSLTSFNVFLSDSICCVVSNSFSAADSFQVPLSNTAPDTTTRCVMAWPVPINKTLRSATTGSGRYTWVTPVSILPVFNQKYDATIPGKWLRVRYTPLRRMTVTGGQSTAGKRVVGLKGFRLWADIYK